MLGDTAAQSPISIYCRQELSATVILLLWQFDTMQSSKNVSGYAMHWYALKYSLEAVNTSKDQHNVKYYR